MVPQDNVLDAKVLDGRELGDIKISKNHNKFNFLAVLSSTNEKTPAVAYPWKAPEQSAPNGDRLGRCRWVTCGGFATPGLW